MSSTSVPKIIVYKVYSSLVVMFYYTFNALVCTLSCIGTCPVLLLLFIHTPVVYVDTVGGSTIWQCLLLKFRLANV